jgi:hypothetical protein
MGRTNFREVCVRVAAADVSGAYRLLHNLSANHMVWHDGRVVKALILGVSPLDRGFESHSCQSLIFFYLPGFYGSTQRGGGAVHTHSRAETREGAVRGRDEAEAGHAQRHGRLPSGGGGLQALLLRGDDLSLHLQLLLQLGQRAQRH